MKRYVFLFWIILSSIGVVAQAGNPDQILGVWKSTSQGLMVKIDKIGDQFQGRIVWLSAHQPDSPALDENNPNQRLQKMPLKGNKIIKELFFNADKKVWEGGTFYHHVDGKVYNCLISLHDSDKIKVTRFLKTHQDGVEETWLRQ